MQASYFQVSRSPLSISRTCLDSMHKFYITLQELQAVYLMLCRVIFSLSVKVAALHLDNITAKLIHKWYSFSFSSRLAYSKLNLADKHCITYLPAWCIPITMWKLIIYHRDSWFQNGIFLLTFLKHHFTSGANFFASSCTNVSIITAWKIHYLWEPWGWMLPTTLEHIRWVLCFLHPP